MFELEALRLSVGATQAEMAGEMQLSLREYQHLERTAGPLDQNRLRSATFAALRIAVSRDGELPRTELFEAFEDLLQRFATKSRSSQLVH